MAKSMRQPTLQTLGLGSVLDIFQQGRLPAATGDLVDQVFGGSRKRGSLVISGANGIVGAGKTMQLGARLQPFDIPIVALDFPGVPDGIGQQYPGLARAFGREDASRIMGNIICLNYDGKNLPPQLSGMAPKFLLEAIPEILDIKKAHYDIFQKAFPGIEIRSVTSGFPRSQLGVGIAHPAFPHEINKIWEVVEPEPSSITQLFWALGLMPIPVSDHWSFVLDVLFCGLTLAGLRYHRASNMPFWKIDKFVRKYFGPNPFRAHDAIGAGGANFLTWSCLHHLSEHYGDVFTPTPELEEHKDSGENWYPLNHFRPLINWALEHGDEDIFRAWILGPLCHMTGLMLHENRTHLSHMNAIGELCAQFRRGILAVIRSLGPDEAIRIAEAYHTLHPEAAQKSWYPDAFRQMDSPEWQQLYVNAEHDGNAGVITISRESYNADVDQELNQAIDWLRGEGIKQVIVSGDFHLSTQMVGADTNEFFPALENVEEGFQIAKNWSQTARRLYTDFEVSVGFLNGKRCLGGMLELMMHCHYLVSVEGVDLGMPEVTLPVVPGMEGCHWPFRKTTPDNWPKLLQLLLEGRSVQAQNAVGWLTDFAGPMEEAIKMAWQIVTGADHGLPLRKVDEEALKGMPEDTGSIVEPGETAMEMARKAIFKSVLDSCSVNLLKAIRTQAKHSADFMATPDCRKGVIGSAYTKTMMV